MSSQESKTEAAGLLEVLKYSIDKQQPDLNRLVSLHESYDNKIDPSIWPTQSEIPTAQHFVAVEEALGPAMDMCFPESNGLQLVPTDVDVTQEQWQSSEWALWTMVHHNMKIRDTALKSVKDCFKCSVGYGIVEPFTITPQSSARVVVGSRSTRIMAQGDPLVSIRYRYISPGKIIPYPSGTNFNGPEATPISFHYDPYPMWQIEAMYGGQQAGDVQPGELIASLSEVQEAAAKFAQKGFSDFTNFKDSMGGRGPTTGSRALPDSAPLEVPIIKVFEQPGTETWIVPSSHAEGVVLLKRQSDGLSRIRNGLVKWDAWPDGDRWFPMSQPEADQKRAFAYDLWLNFFFDMMSRAKDTPRVIDKSALPPDGRSLSFYEDIYIEKGSARDAVSNLDPPRIDPAIPAMGDTLQGLGQQINGISDFTQKNFTRGGSNAFNDLLNTMQSRQRLTSTILETGALSHIYEHVLSYMQGLVTEDGYDLQRPIYDPGEERTLLQRKTITIEDLRHGYNVVLDTAERRMLGGMSDQARFQYWQALIDREDMRPFEVHKIFPLPDTTLRRIVKPREQLEEQQEVNREVRLTGELAGGGQSGAGGTGAAIATAEQGGI